MRKLKTKLNKDGVLISSILNVRDAKNLFILMIRQNWNYKESGILDSTHFRFFTRKSVKRMYEKSCITVQVVPKASR